jgi:hypothetical protein
MYTKSSNSKGTIYLFLVTIFGKTGAAPGTIEQFQRVSGRHPSVRPQNPPIKLEVGLAASSKRMCAF